jgi:hypothetical protein
MDTVQHNRIADFIWGIADDVLRDIYVRGKYRDVILPMTVVRRLDSVLEPTKDDVLAMKARLDEAGIPAQNQDAALRGAAKQAFYNTSPFTLRSLLGQPYQNAIRNSDRQNARIEHDRVLKHVIASSVADHAELYKHFEGDPSFKQWLGEPDFRGDVPAARFGVASRLRQLSRIVCPGRGLAADRVEVYGGGPVGLAQSRPVGVLSAAWISACR